jgi:acetylglutamate kinase
MKNLNIVKIGGNIIDNPSELETAIKKFALLPGLKLLVHGGGKIASEISARLNIKSNLIDGRRITDADSLEVVQMVYAGLINKNIVANLQK